MAKKSEVEVEEFMAEEVLKVWEKAELQRLAPNERAQGILKNVLVHLHPDGRVPLELYQTAFSLAAHCKLNIRTFKYHLAKYKELGEVEPPIPFEFSTHAVWYTPSCPRLVAKFKIPVGVSYEDALNEIQC
jgi:hypothetical protein